MPRISAAKRDRFPSVGFMFANVAGDALEAVAGFVDGRGDGGRDDRRGAVRATVAVMRSGRGAVAFHHVMATRAVNVHVDEAGNDGHPAAT